MRRKGYGMYIAAVIVVFIFGVLFFLGTIRHSNDSAQTSDIAAPTLTDENNKSTEETATSGMPGSVHDQDEQDAESDTATSSNSEASKEINTEGLDTASNIPDGYETAFTEFAVSDTSSQKNNGYAERVEPITGKTNYEVKQEQLNKLNLTLVLSDSGYPMSVFNGQYTLYTGTDSDGNTLQYIVSGADAVEYTGNFHTFDTLIVARQEGTAQRIHIFKSQDQVDTFIRERSEGAEALNNANDSGDWKIVLNGQLVENASPMLGDDGQLYLPMRQLVETYNPNYTQFDGAAGILYAGLDGCLFSIPCDEASSYMKNKLEFFTGDDGYERYRYSDMGMGGNIVTVTGTPRVPQTAEYMWVTPDDLAFILGWDVSIKGHTISVVSDPLDDSDLYMLFDVVASGTFDS